MGAVNKDSVLGASLVLSIVSLVLLLGVTCYFQTSLTILQQQVTELQEQASVKCSSLRGGLFSKVLQFGLHGDPSSLTEGCMLNGSAQNRSWQSQDENRIQNVVRRQTSDGCQCKDGSPGPRGPEGRKGEQGLPGQVGPKGDLGEMGPRGPIGDQGFPGMKGRAGEKGNQGDQGFPGPRGIMGLKGLQGVTGLKGDLGEKGGPGMKGANGTKGEKGDMGEKGIDGVNGEKGSQGDVGNPGQQGARGRRGEKGDRGEPGLRGEKGDTGLQGIPGPKGEQGVTGEKGEIGSGVSRGKTSDSAALVSDDLRGAKESTGTVYIRWGNNECQPSASLVYSGRAAGSHFRDKGGATNPQCLPLNPTYLSVNSGKDEHFSATIYGAEYQLHGSLGRSSHQSDVPCAVCHANRSAQFMLPAQHECPSGWTTEYYGYLMASRPDLRRTQYTCVDVTFTPVTNSAANKDGLLFYTVEGRCGSLPCPPYEETKELTCAVCTK